MILIVVSAFGQSVMDPKALDRAVDPCVDFYQYACGGWMKANPIPPDQTRWLRFQILNQQNANTLRTILESAVRDATVPAAKKMGAAYAACMDEAAVNERGLAPLKPQLERIAAITSRQGITEVITMLHHSGINVLFRFQSQQDLKNAKVQIGSLNVSPLGLPDRDLYFQPDARSVGLRKAYAEHVTAMFQFAGKSSEDATAMAQRVVKFEATIAKAMLDRVSQREPKNSYHIYTIAELVSLAPGFAWQDYFARTGAPTFGEMTATLNVSHPPFFREIESQIVQASLDEWKAYLTWHVLRFGALRLPTPFVDEFFRFYGKTLNGQRENEPRWKRCVNDVTQSLRDAVGQRFVEATFGQDGKWRIDNMVANLRDALGRDIDSLDWMSAATKKEARTKLAAVTEKIGHPAKWDDYAALELRPDDYYRNYERIGAYNRKKSLEKIGKPVDRGEWQIPASTVDAFYGGSNNEITFPAGILQPPFFDRNADDAANYGAIGTVIGHEFTHGFDDQGRKFDAAGDLRDWWTAQDAKEYERRAQCFVDEYSKFESAGLKLNGRLTLGENTADNGGVRIALLALLATIKKPGETLDGFTPEQRFFLAFGQTWCNNTTEQIAKILVSTDPHSPGQWRANGTVRNMPEFAKAFACRVDQPMTRGPACRVW